MGRRLLLLAVLLGSCGEDEDPAAARMKCETLRDVFCGRVAGCYVEAGWVPATSRDAVRNQCSSEFTVDVDCSRSVDVGGTYDQCIRDIGTVTCPALFGTGRAATLPASCNGVIKQRG